MRTDTWIAPLLGLLMLGSAFAQSTEPSCAAGDPASSTGGAAALSLDSGTPPPPPPGHGPQLTAEEKAQLDAMTPEQRHAFFEAKRQAFLATLTPEQRAEMEARHKERGVRRPRGQGPRGARPPRGAQTRTQ